MNVFASLDPWESSLTANHWPTTLLTSNHSLPPAADASANASYEPYTLPDYSTDSVPTVTPDQAIYAINHSLDTLWVLVCAFLVFFMQVRGAAALTGWE